MVCLGFRDIAAPENDVLLTKEAGYVGVGEDIFEEGGGVFVIFGGENDKEELGVILCCVESLGVTTFEPREAESRILVGLAASSDSLLKVANISCGPITRIYGAFGGRPDLWSKERKEVGK